MPDKQSHHQTPEYAKETWPPPSEGNIKKLLETVARHFANVSYDLTTETLTRGLTIIFDRMRLTKSWTNNKSLNKKNMMSEIYLLNILILKTKTTK